MNIQNKPQIYNYQATPAFKSSVTGECITDILRPDLDWKSFINMLVKKYKHTGKINIIVGGCADGSEAFQTAMLLIRKLGKKESQKFFPIKAWDINAKILQNPKEGIIKVTKQDLARLEKFMGKDYLEYVRLDNKFKIDPESGIEYCTGRIKSILKDTVLFEHKDFTKNISRIPKDNTVLMSRNIWPYFPDGSQPKLAKELFNRLGDNSLFIAGEFELGSGLNPVFLDTGFNVTEWLGYSPCYTKPSFKGREQLSNPDFLMATFAKRK